MNFEVRLNIRKLEEEPWFPRLNKVRTNARSERKMKVENHLTSIRIFENLAELFELMTQLRITRNDNGQSMVSRGNELSRTSRGYFIENRRFDGNTASVN